jgi:hypothetical protein
MSSSDMGRYMSPSDQSASIEDLAADVSACFAGAIEENRIGEIPDEILGQLFASILRVFAAKAQEGVAPRPFGRNSGITQTEVMIGCVAMLEAVESNVFELGMWSSMTSIGRRRRND